jgi:hypothetical protein
VDYTSWPLPKNCTYELNSGGDTKVGILIFQMPVEKINRLMTHDQNWTDTGLGDSCETYIVEPDKKCAAQADFFWKIKRLTLN